MTMKWNGQSTVGYVVTNNPYSAYYYTAAYQDTIQDTVVVTQDFMDKFALVGHNEMNLYNFTAGRKRDKTTSQDEPEVWGTMNYILFANNHNRIFDFQVGDTIEYLFEREYF